MSIALARILLAADGSKDADLAAHAAMDLSSRTGAEYHVVYARQDVRLAGIPPHRNAGRIHAGARVVGAGG